MLKVAAEHSMVTQIKVNAERFLGYSGDDV